MSAQTAGRGDAAADASGTMPVDSWLPGIATGEMPLPRELTVEFLLNSSALGAADMEAVAVTSGVGA